MTTKRSHGEIKPDRNALVKEKRIHGKAAGQDVATNSKHPAPDTPLSPSVRTNREEDDRRRITPQGPNTTAWKDRCNCLRPTLFSLQRLNVEHAQSRCRGDSYINCRV